MLKSPKTHYKTPQTEAIQMYCLQILMSSDFSNATTNEAFGDNGQEPATSDLVFTAAHEGVTITKTTLNSDLTPEWVKDDANRITRISLSDI